jgi:hypothetical protein
MASASYTSANTDYLEGDLDLLAIDLRAILIDTANYTFSAAHDFLDDVPAGARESDGVALAGRTVTAGVLDANDTVLTNTTTGVSVEAVILYEHTGNDATSRLVAYIDGLTGTTNGLDVTVAWDNGANKIIKLG